MHHYLWVIFVIVVLVQIGAHIVQAGLKLAK